MKLKDPELKKGSFLSITLLILSGELIFLLPYVLARVFRPTFLEVFNLTNLELGSLFSIYGTVAILSYLYGGVISDKFQPKKLIAISLFFTAFGGIVLSTYPSYLILQILWGYWGFTTVFLFWGAMIKATRVWGGSKNQGEAFGLLDGGRGLVAASMGTLGVVIFSMFLTNDIELASLVERKNAFRYVILQQQVIDFVKEQQILTPRKDHRLTLHHMGYFTKQMAKEMAVLGIEASVNPYYLWALSDKYSEYGLEKKRAENLVAIKLLTDEGIPVSFHSWFVF